MLDLQLTTHDGFPSPVDAKYARLIIKMSEPKQESEPVEAKTSDQPSAKDPYTAVKNVGPLESDAQVILKGRTKNNALFASGPDLHDKSSFHNQVRDVLSTADSAIVRGFAQYQFPDDQRTAHRRGVLEQTLLKLRRL